MVAGEGLGVTALVRPSELISAIQFTEEKKSNNKEIVYAE